MSLHVSTPLSNIFLTQTQIAQCCLEGDHDKDKALIAEMSKLIGNSLDGQMITNKEKHHYIIHVDESEISTEIIDNHF